MTAIAPPPDPDGVDLPPSVDLRGAADMSVKVLRGLLRDEIATNVELMREVDRLRVVHLCASLLMAELQREGVAIPGDRVVTDLGEALHAMEGNR